MNLVIEKYQQAQVRKDLPTVKAGDTVRVHVRLKEAEGEKERIQPFEGVVIKKRGKSTGQSFTVRRVSFGVGIERVFPANSPSISAIEVLREGRVRRAKLYYLRARKGKAARLQRVERVEAAPAAAAKSAIQSAGEPAGEAASKA
jgi:large subunit ribosomal protein L19